MAREWIGGRNPVLELLRADRRRVHRLWLARDAAGERLAECQRLARDRRIAVTRVPREQLAETAAGGNLQGIAVETDGYPYVSLENLLARAARADEAPFLLLSAGIQDPHNLGSLIRTGDAAGIDGVILQKRRAVGITPAVVRVSAGASEHVHIARVANLVRCMERLKEAGIWVFGGDPDGDLRFDETDLSSAVAMVVGSEGGGLPRLVRERCDGLLTIPQKGRVASLNAAVAGALLLYAVRSSRDRP